MAVSRSVSRFANRRARASAARLAVYESLENAAWIPSNSESVRTSAYSRNLTDLDISFAVGTESVLVSIATGRSHEDKCSLSPGYSEFSGT